MTTPVDVAVIGAGPAGALAAWHLARGGLNVVLFEKQRQPHHKVCGEFISAEGLPYLKEMGVDLDKLGATTISNFRLHGPTRSCAAKLRHACRGVSRIRLDERMIEAATGAGAALRRGEAVQSLRRLDGAGFGIETSGGVLTAGYVICATGKIDFKPVRRRAGRDSGMVGFKLHLRLGSEALALLQTHVDLFVFEGGYGGLAPVEDGLVNFCFLLEKAAMRPVEADWPAMAQRFSELCPELGVYLADSEAVFWPPVTVANVPYGFVRKEAADTDLYCVGDQLAVIPSLTGDGMAIAMMSARRAAEHILSSRRDESGVGARDFHEEMARVLRPQVNFGFHVHRLFKAPRLCDIGMLAVRLWPGLVDLVIRKTRSPALGEASTR